MATNIAELVFLLAIPNWRFYDGVFDNVQNACRTYSRIGRLSAGRAYGTCDPSVSSPLLPHPALSGLDLGGAIRVHELLLPHR